jgi:hypothetical protein
MSFALALVFAAVVGLGAYRDFQQSADGPRERATIVARHEAGPNTCPGTGRRNWEPKWDVMWRSEDPPSGLPAEFVVERVCDSNDVGYSAEIIRVIEDGQTKVYEDVAHGGRDVLELAVSRSRAETSLTRSRHYAATRAHRLSGGSCAYRLTHRALM